MKKNRIDTAISKADGYLTQALDYDTDDNYSLRGSLKSLRKVKTQISIAENSLRKHTAKNSKKKK